MGFLEVARYTRDRACTACIFWWSIMKILLWSYSPMLICIILSACKNISNSACKENTYRNITLNHDLCFHYWMIGTRHHKPVPRYKFTVLTIYIPWWWLNIKRWQDDSKFIFQTYFLFFHNFIRPCTVLIISNRNGNIAYNFEISNIDGWFP